MTWYKGGMKTFRQIMRDNKEGVIRLIVFLLFVILVIFVIGLSITLIYFSARVFSG